MTEASRQALSILRSPEHFSWYVIPMLAFVIYVYISEIEKQNWHVVLTGLVYYAAEITWEIFNALILKFTGYAALWSSPGDTAYLILVGLNIEISMMFCVAGVIVCKSLPEDKNAKVFGLPNRWIIPLLWGLFCAFVEILLNQAGALVWDWPFWSWPHVYVIVAAYTIPFFGATWIYDHWSLATKKKALVFCVAFDVAAWVLFVNVLHWI